MSQGCGERPNRGKCLECNEWYYLKKNENECGKCEIYNCKECREDLDKDEIICNNCLEGYELSGGKCLKYCEIGENEKCKTCNNEEGKINECLTCNKGYCLTHNKKCDICDSIKYFNESVIIKNMVQNKI